MKAILKYHLIFLCAALLGLCLTMSCDKKEEENPVPGTDTQLKAPQDYSYKVMGTTVKLVWRAQTEAVSFNLQVSDNEAFGNPQVIATAAASHTIEALAVKTKYWTRVQAVAAVESNTSAWSEGIAFTTGDENILRAEPKEALDTQITLQWTPGAAVTHFVVTPDGDEALPQRDISDSEKETGEATVTGLAPETLYNVKLYNSANLRGEGEYATIPLILDDLPVTLANAAPDSLNLSWTPDDAGLTHFTVTPEPLTGGATVTVDGASGAATINNLLPETEYTLALYSGNSTRGDTVFTTAALEPVTLAPTDVQPQSATMAWTPADKYVSRLEFKPATGTAITVEVTEADAAGKEVGGLTPDTDYAVTLQYIAGSNTYSRGVADIKTTIPPKPKARYVPANGSIIDTLANSISGDTLVLAAGAIYTWSSNNYAWPTGKSAIIMGADAANKTTISVTVGTFMTLPAEADSIVFKNLEISRSTPAGGDYFINQAAAVACNVGTLAFDGCTVTGFGRSIVRLQTNATTTGRIGTLRVHNTIVKDCGNQSGQNYAFIQSTAYGKIDNVVFTNSTFNNVSPTTNLISGSNSTQVIQNITINNCTFYNVLGNRSGSTLYLIDGGSAANTNIAVDIRNSILGKVHNPTATNKGTRGCTVTSTNTYQTTDWVTDGTSDIPGTTAYANTSDNLFTAPATGDFTIKDGNFAGKSTAGDPRWRGEGGGGGGGGDTPGTIVNGFYVVSDGEYIQTTEDNVKGILSEWVSATAQVTWAARTKCYAGTVANIGSNVNRIVTFKVKGAASFTIQVDGNGSRYLTYTINGGTPITSKTYINGCDTEDVSTGTTGECTIEIGGNGGGSVYLHGITFHK